MHFLFGLAKTDRLIAEIKAELEGAAAQSRRTGKPARRFKDFRWMTRSSWSCQRRVVAKAEWTKDEANPRFVVTSLTRAECKARYLYEKVYCARGDMENRIKECQLDLYADRTSAGHHAGKPAAPVVCLDGLCAAVRVAPHRPAPHAVRQSDLRHHSSQAAQDRRPRARVPAASRLRWRQRVRQPIPGAALPSVSPLPPTRGPRPPDTRRRNA